MIMKYAFFRSLVLNESKYEGKQRMLSKEKNYATLDSNRRAVDNNEEERIS